MKIKLSLTDIKGIFSSVNNSINYELVENYSHLNVNEWIEKKKELQREVLNQLEKWIINDCQVNLEFDTDMKTIMVIPNYEKI